MNTSAYAHGRVLRMIWEYPPVEQVRRVGRTWIARGAMHACG